ncbi:uncharacterized protein LOC108666140 [Hyalella azteca]|uniref:Uncharacterized protein LOC108666140 n=1 Tax=Hyalella azteca TaxID=294128 RepID=A0A8B7N4E2_HYAAZ|nr:uncharacterized protein LOC108666140 [Hyalella azteca]XP_018008446.1 uncharacterized protein LOC108666140 [Hyalella azteca]
MADVAAASSLALLYTGSLIWVGFIGLGALIATGPLGYGGPHRNFGPRPRFRGGPRGRYRRPHGYHGHSVRGHGGFKRLDEDSNFSGNNDIPAAGHGGDIPDYARFSNMIQKSFKHSNEGASRPAFRRARSVENLPADRENWSPVKFFKRKGAKNILQGATMASDPIAEPKSRNKLDWYPNLSALLYSFLPVFSRISRSSQNQKTPEEERMVQAIYKSDIRRCGPRLVCELSAIRHRQLTFEELQILQFVWHGDKFFNELFPGEGIRSDSAALTAYKNAARIGTTGGDCQHVFRSCPVNAASMMASVYSLARL